MARAWLSCAMASSARPSRCNATPSMLCTIPSCDCAAFDAGITCNASCRSRALSRARPASSNTRPRLMRNAPLRGSMAMARSRKPSASSRAPACARMHPSRCSASASRGLAATRRRAADSASAARPDWKRRIASAAEDFIDARDGPRPRIDLGPAHQLDRRIPGRASGAGIDPIVKVRQALEENEQRAFASAPRQARSHCSSSPPRRTPDRGEDPVQAAEEVSPRCVRDRAPRCCASRRYRRTRSTSRRSSRAAEARTPEWRGLSPFDGARFWKLCHEIPTRRLRASARGIATRAGIGGEEGAASREARGGGRSAPPVGHRGVTIAAAKAACDSRRHHGPLRMRASHRGTRRASISSTKSCPRVSRSTSGAE